MNNAVDPVKSLQDLSVAPSSPDDFAKWVEGTSGITFLRSSASDEDVVIYASFSHVFVHAVFVPNQCITPPDWNDLLGWHGNPGSGWGLSYSFGPDPTVNIEAPLHLVGSRALAQGEQLVFRRFFEGHRTDKSYFEILQRFIQVFDIHYVRERRAYCRLDKRGDLEDVVRIVTVAESKASKGGVAITCNRSLIEQWCAATDSALARMFDFTRVKLPGFSGWRRTSPQRVVEASDLAYRTMVEAGHAGYVRGVQLIRPVMTKTEVIERFENRLDDDGHEYASFTAVDWKNGGIVTSISTDPAATANYFTESSLPFEMSMAFFRPEVLTKYKADSEKYTLDNRAISCRGAWHLTTYDINDKGQVHTYICYLRDLPYEEQLHWKAYNEPPKAPISARALNTDFKGHWDLSYDPLESLLARVQRWSAAGVPWWALRAKESVGKTHYPVTTSADEWALELMHLDQLLVEGFEQKWLRQRAKELSREVESNWGSLKLLEECLVGLDVEDAEAKAVVAPLRRLHELRNKLKGHVSGEEGNRIKEDSLERFGTFVAHYRALCTDCDAAAGKIAELLGFADRTRT